MLKHLKSRISLRVPPQTWTADLAIHEPEIVVAFMGVTGSGKSSFIKALTGRNDIVVGHGLTSSTSQRDL
jgi:ABC-type proline/glycine betaine transport system ATPase subunit